MRKRIKTCAEDLLKQAQTDAKIKNETQTQESLRIPTHLPFMGG